MPTIESVFDVAGSTETSLTKSLAVILKKDKTALNNLITRVFTFPLRISKREFENTIISTETSSSLGRVDIQIENPTVHVILEGKVRRGQVALEQASRYCRILSRSKSRFRGFGYITEVGNVDVDPRLESAFKMLKFASISWDETLSLLKRRKRILVNLVDEYEKYLIGAQRMRIHDIDVWAVVVRGEQITNFEKGDYYIHFARHSPIFIARREWDPVMKKVLVKALRPVLRVHDPRSSKGRNNNQNYVYDLGRAIELKNPIVRKFGQAAAISLGFAEVAKP